MFKISEKQETSELLATVGIPQNDFSRIRINQKGLYIILDRPNSPGNLGTSLRSCDVFGVDGVFIAGHAADPYDPKAVRSSVGSLFSQTVIRINQQLELLDWLQALREKFGTVQIIGSSAKGLGAIEQIKMDGPVVLIAGSESNGMSTSYAAMCDTIVRIPQHGSASSLIVSCALSILLYEISKRRNS
jgi:TrmH family RNA methyltransferase